MYHVPHPYMSCMIEDCQECWDHENGKNYCEICNQNTLSISTIHCPKFELTINQLAQVKENKLQFYNSKWWTANE